jgi:glucose-1-phosphate cytidylyltransferase
MQLVIFAGGLGTRMGQETAVKPKPMLEIGDKPIIWHIMSYYSKFGVNDFIVLAGYRSIELKTFFRDLSLHSNQVFFDPHMQTYTAPQNLPWRVTILDTGQDAETELRLFRAKDFIEGDEFFCTYGDGLADVNLQDLLSFHRSRGATATVTAFKPQSRFGELIFSGEGLVSSFREKPTLDNYINIGFMCLNRRVFDFIDGTNRAFETGLLSELASKSLLYSYVHTGTWKPIDNPRELNEMNEIWRSGSAWWA